MKEAVEDKGINNKSCFNCEWYCNNGWAVVCLNMKNKEGIVEVEKGKDKEYCKLWKERSNEY